MKGVFLHEIAKAFHEEFVVSLLIHDLDSCIELYKKYFSKSEYLLIENDPNHPFLICSKMDSQGIKSVIENFGYYTLEAYLYWTRDGICFNDGFIYDKDYLFMDQSLLTIRQVLDLSLEIQVNDRMLSTVWDILKKQLIF